LPLKREDNMVVVLIDNPEDLQHVDSVSQALKNRKIKWAVGLRQDILAYLNVTTGEPTAKGAIGHILGELKAEDAPAESTVDIAERRKPQDGKIRFKMPDSREIELRVATVPTANQNEDVVMRILTASEPMPLDKLGMTERNLTEIKKIAVKPYGLVLCVGPT